MHATVTRYLRDRLPGLLNDPNRAILELLVVLLPALCQGRSLWPERLRPWGNLRHCGRAGSVEATARHEPLHVLPGDRGDAVVVLVVVQHWDVGAFGGCGDEQVWMSDRTVV